MCDALDLLYQPLEEILAKFPNEEAIETSITELGNSLSKTHASTEALVKKLENIGKVVEEDCSKNSDRLSELSQVLNKYQSRAKQLQIRHVRMEKEAEFISRRLQAQSELTKNLSAKREALALKNQCLNI